MPHPANARNPSQRAASQRGFTLIEVLVSLIILAIGLLGIISLQYTSKQVSYDSLQRSNAAMFAEDLVERIRANPGTVTVDTVIDAYIPFGGPTGTTPGRSYADGAGPATPPTDCGAADADCSPQDLAAWDLDEWWTQVIGAAEENSSGGLLLPRACLFNLNADDNSRSGELIIAIAWAGRNEIPDNGGATGTPLEAAQSCGFGNADYVGPTGGSLRRFIVQRAFVHQ